MEPLRGEYRTFREDVDGEDNKGQKGAPKRYIGGLSPSAARYYGEWIKYMRPEEEEVEESKESSKS
jgi:hypothetical protein